VPVPVLPCYGVEVFLDEIGSPFCRRVVFGGCERLVAVWESYEAKETMVMTMSSLESPLAADPVILMSSRKQGRWFYDWFRALRVHGLKERVPGREEGLLAPFSLPEGCLVGCVDVLAEQGS
jgi:hypothetical protein